MRRWGVESITSPDRLLFFRSLLVNPRAMGAVAPSSPKLARMVASRVDAASAPVLEIGAGTGAITKALLERGVRPECLYVIERNPSLATFLGKRFPKVRVYCGDAIDSRRILSDYALPHVRTVVSSLPLRNFSPADRNENVDAMLNWLPADGQLIQYTYAPDCPISTLRFGLEAEYVGRVWQNLPPASVWRFQKRLRTGCKEARSVAASV